MSENGLCVECSYNFDVGVVNGSSRCGGGCLCNGGAELVRIGRTLGGTVVTNRCGGIVFGLSHACHCHLFTYLMLPEKMEAMQLQMVPWMDL